MRARAELAATLAGVAVLACCGRAPLPPHLAGMARLRIVSGPHAQRLVSYLHGRPVTGAAVSMAEYGQHGQLRVWLAHYPDFPTAHRELERMVAAMRERPTRFRRPAADPRLPNRWITIGNGAHHLFWVSGHDLFWLEGTPEAVFAAAEELPAPSATSLV